MGNVQNDCTYRELKEKKLLLIFREISHELIENLNEESLQKQTLHNI